MFDNDVGINWHLRFSLEEIKNFKRRKGKTYKHRNNILRKKVDKTI